MAGLKEQSTLCKGTHWANGEVRLCHQMDELPLRGSNGPGGIPGWPTKKGKGKPVPLRQDGLGASWLGSSSAEKALGLLLDPKLSRSQQRVLRAQGCLPAHQHCWDNPVPIRPGLGSQELDFPERVLPRR